jgi:bis(5'-nucleosyl)-tetraphosphatase (symmetrical)
MSIYVIGDLQGCFEPLQRLLDHISFHPKKDTLWFTGDLVNRGPQSLECLRFVRNLGDCQRIVLGNHDLHLLAVAHNARQAGKNDTLNDILNAPDKHELLDWLMHQPLLHHEYHFTMVHAGLAASWDLAKAKALAHEVETILQSDQAYDFFKHMYGNHPNTWSDDLQGFERLRCITNYFTRARFCHVDGSLDLENKGKIDSTSSELIPWFKVPHRKNAELKILFGHWAALRGVTDTPNTYALDTGCIWGYTLTAMRLEDQVRFSVPCKL